MTRRRKLRPEEQDLWRQVARTTVPLIPGPKPEIVIEDNQMPSTKQTTSETLPEIPMFRVGECARKDGSAPKDVSGKTRVPTTPSTQMDKKAFTRLKRGKLKPEARIDLHGMTLAQAHPALTGFILRSHSDGKRLVLVITGKGSDVDEYDLMPRQRGVLRQQVPHWLKMAPLAGLILEVRESHLRHGGSGAYYVYLRRGR